MRNFTDTGTELPHETAELAEVIPIRTETAFSQYPIHYLGKGQEMGEMRIVTERGRGKSSMVWRVAANAAYGAPGPLAYKLDTLLINRLIDDARPNIPEVIKLGSLCNIAHDLGIKPGGSSLLQIKQALYQNASAMITAKFDYTDIDGARQGFEFGSTRYGVAFTGETLPNGEKADGVYLVLNPIFREMLKRAKTRPLDYKYLRALPPAAQRVYELISPQIFAAIKHGNDHANYLYSELCRYAPLTRYTNREQARKQLFKIHQPHLKSGYLAKVELEDCLDTAGHKDWTIRYKPGRKAKAEFKRFNTKEGRALERPLRPVLVAPVPAEPAGANELDAETSLLVQRLVAAGVTVSVAGELAAAAAAECVRQLEALPHRKRVKNKGAYLVQAIRGCYALPAELAEAQQRMQRATAEAAALAARTADWSVEALAEQAYAVLSPADRRAREEAAQELLQANGMEALLDDPGISANIIRSVVIAALKTELGGH